MSYKELGAIVAGDEPPQGKFDQQIRLKLRLVDRLGPQKIDLVIAGATDQPFVHIAGKAGVPPVRH